MRSSIRGRAEERRKRTGLEGIFADRGSASNIMKEEEEESKLVKSRYPYNHGLYEESRIKFPPKRPSNSVSHIDANSTLPADIATICGSHAKSASLKRPTSYQARDALTSKSRVLITGILGQVGFNLALALSEQCGVRTIIGIDGMYPNTISHRLEMARRMATLYNSVPDLVRPLPLSVTGIDQPSSSQRNSWEVLPATGELDIIARYKPTHVVHLAGGADANSYRDAVGAREGKLNVDSAYVAEGGAKGDGGGGSAGRIAPLFQIRQAGTSMEHILTSIAKQQRRDGGEEKEDGGNADVANPHFTYASVAQQSVLNDMRQDGDFCDEGSLFHESTGAIDELLANQYYYTDGIYSVGLRLPTIYGPMDKPGNPEYDITAAAAKAYLSGRENITTNELLNATGHLNVCRSQKRQRLFVDDAVDAIISAMQYRRKGGEAVAFNMPNGEMSLSSLAGSIRGYLSYNASDAQKKLQSLAVSKAPRVYEYLAWKPIASFREGVAKHISWHLDTVKPYGPSRDAVVGSVAMTGKKFLTKMNITDRNDADWRRFRGRPLLPCASECTRSMYCIGSVFDSTIKIARDVTDGCDIVFYSSALDINATDVPFETQYPSNTASFGDMCNVAFVSRDSPLVHSLVSSVGDTVLKERKLSPKSSVSSRIERLNGRLFFRGWIIIFVPTPSQSIQPAVKSMIKLAPRRLFAASVSKAVYVEGNFTRPVSYVDALFLSTFLRREGSEARQILRQDASGQKHPLVFPPDPVRKAVMVAPIMKHPKLMVNASVDPSPNIGIKTAVKVMQLEAGLDPLAPESEPPRLRRQSEFYQFVRSILNRKELRSNFEPNYLYDARHWITSSSLVHDFTSEEGRELRCRWLEEHTLWSNEYDQLSFAHVMAINKLERQLRRVEPDVYSAEARLGRMSDSERVLYGLINANVDWHQWHSILSDDEKAGRTDPSQFISMDDVIADMIRVKKLLPERDINKTDYFVRIFLPDASALERQSFDKEMRRGKPLPRTKTFIRGKRIIFIVNENHTSSRR